MQNFFEKCLRGQMTLTNGTEKGYLNPSFAFVTFRHIQQFSKLYPDSDIPLRNWYKAVAESNWNCFADMKQTFGSVDNVGNSRFVFNIKGNTYRLIAIVIFASKKVYIRFIGTHKDYDRIKDCSTI